MMTFRHSFLSVLGAGVAATAMGGTDGSTDVFARRFLDDGVRMQIPDMVYDPALQIMVDPSGKAVYRKDGDVKIAKVTAGCDDCPKYDE